MQYQFQSFREAAEFFTSKDYDAACEFVRQEIKAGRIKIAPFKTNWSALLEALMFCFFSFLALGACCAMMAWVQIDTVCPQWIFLVFAFVTMTTWLVYSIKACCLFLCEKCRRID